MAPFSQGLEPPQNPGRFRAAFAAQKLSVPLMTGVVAALNHIQSQNIPFATLRAVLALTPISQVDG